MLVSGARIAHGQREPLAVPSILNALLKLVRANPAGIPDHVARGRAVRARGAAEAADQELRTNAPDFSTSRSTGL